MKSAIRIAPFIKPYTGKILVIFFLTIITTLLSVIYPYFSKVLIDDVFLNHNSQLLLIISLAFLGITIVGYLSGALNGYLYTLVASNILFDMRLALFRHLQRLSIKFFKKTSVGEIISRINSDIAEVQGFATDTLLKFATNLLTLLGATIFLLYLNWKLLIATNIFVPLGVIGIRYFKFRINEGVRKIREKNAEIESFLVESFTAIKFIKTFMLEEKEAKKFFIKSREFIKALLSFQMLAFLSGSIPGLFLYGTTLVVFLYGGHMVIQGDMTIGSLVAFTAYQAKILGPIQNLMGLYIGIQRAKVSLKRVFEFMDIDGDIKEINYPHTLSKVLGEIKFNNVFLNYEEQKGVLENVSFTIPRGAVTAIIGPSGAGKSSIVDLILRLYDPTAGSILLDGIDLKDIKLSSLRSSISVIEHEPFLFHTTIEENIKYVSENATFADVVNAAKAAQIHNFIESLPQGYKTVVGERGTRLSSGQRQRIAIARAFLLNPKILILDEATSSLDLISENQVRSMIHSLMKDRTTIIVTHRLSSITNADKIILIEGGKVIQQGSHEDLFSRESLYQKLYLLGGLKGGKRGDEGIAA